MSGFIDEQYEIELIHESGNPDGLPLDVNWIRLEDPPGGENVKAQVFICDSGGPVVAVEALAGLLAVEQPFLPYPSAATPDFYAVESLPSSSHHSAPVRLSSWTPTCR